LKLINKVQLTYGAQSIVGGLEVQSFDDLTPMFNGGRDYTSLSFDSKIDMYRDFNITEIILTNIFADGTFTADPKHYETLSETFDLNCIIGGGLKEFLGTSREFSGSFLSSGVFKKCGFITLVIILISLHLIVGFKKYLMFCQLKWFLAIDQC
jgi:imidazole glycerol phosphate synthase subunit HisF